MAKERKERKPKDFMGVYKKRYDTSEGFGDPQEWRAAFNARMGLNEAREVLGSQDPFDVLGVPHNASWAEIKKQYRAMAMQFHPDRNPGDDEAANIFKEKQAAYEILEDRFGK